jgi:hypothetical protein
MGSQRDNPRPNPAHARIARILGGLAAFLVSFLVVSGLLWAQSREEKGLADLAGLIDGRSGRGAPAKKLIEGLNHFTTKHYNVYSDMKETDLTLLSKHMDSLFDNYTQRFRGFKADADANQRMSLFIFKTKAGYTRFFDKMGISGTNTGGMFFVNPDAQGLAVFLEGRGPQQVYSVLQHEGFHQFAFTFIGSELPIWVNEGIAQYFEDGILINDKFYLGLASARRVQSVKGAIELNKAIDFDKLLETTDGEWIQNLVTGSARGSLQYDQSWSMVYFLIQGEGGKYQQAFDKYLRLVSEKKDSLAAFKEAFGSEDTSAFKKKWQAWALTVQPDYLSQAVDRMTFLGEAMGHMAKNKIPIPNSTEGLRSTLQKYQFKLTLVNHHGVPIEYLASNESLYRYRTGSGPGKEVFFNMMAPTNVAPLPRLSAPLLSPTPTLSWVRDAATNELIYNISYTAKP